jgi:hypothetical protein
VKPASGELSWLPFCAGKRAGNLGLALISNLDHPLAKGGCHETDGNITPKYFTRNYMAKQRHSFRDQYESLVDLPEREKDDMLEALYSKYGSASGTYRVENGTLTFEPIVGGNPALLGRRPSRQIDLDPSGTRLSLKGTMTRGYGVEEVWVRLEDFD